MKKNIAVFLLAFLSFTACKKTKEPLNQLEGKINKDVISFSPKVTGRILALYKKEGDTVNKGDTLALLNVPEVEAKIAQAKGAVKAAVAQHEMTVKGATENQLKQLEAKHRGTKDQYDLAKKSFDRANAMYQDSMMSPQDYDVIAAKHQGAIAQLDAVTAELNEARKGVRVEMQTSALGLEQQALGGLREANVAYDERYIIATNSMKIETISLKEGELATAGFALFNGYIPESVYFRFTVPESEVNNYLAGKTVQVQVPYNNTSYPSKIIRVNQLARYANVTTAYPDYKMEEGLFELKVVPQENLTEAFKLLTNANAVIKKQ